MRAKIATTAVMACRRSGLLALCLAMVTLLVPASAHARLALLTCGGSSASEGWSSFRNEGGDSVPTCSQTLMFESTTFPPGMEANLTEGAREGTRAGLEFRAPSGETISGGDITVVPLGRGEGGEPGGPVASQLATGRLEDVFWEGVNNRINTGLLHEPWVMRPRLVGVGRARRVRASPVRLLTRVSGSRTRGA